MTLHVDPAGVLRAWLHGVDAGSELRSARSRTPAAAGSEMAGLAGVLSDAADDLAGVLDVCDGLVTEHGTNVEACLQDYDTSDHASAGAFHGLR